MGHAISKNLHLRPTGALNPLAVAIQYHKTEEQIPSEYGKPVVPLTSQSAHVD